MAAIDPVCATFTRELKAKNIAPVSGYKKVGNENECGREIPRLFRILNRPIPPQRAKFPPPSLTTTNFPFMSSVWMPVRQPNRWKKTVWSTRNACHNRYDPFEYQQETYSAQPFTSTVAKHPSVDNTHSPSANAHATLPLLRPRAPPPPPNDDDDDDLVASTLSAEQRVVQRPGSNNSTDFPPKFTDPFSGRKYTPLPANALSDMTPSTMFAELGSDRRTTTSSNDSQPSTPESTIADPNDEMVESEWCEAEPVVHVPRRGLYSDVVKHDAKDSSTSTLTTVEVVSPRPVDTHRYQDTQRWLESLSRELAAE